MRNPFLSGSIDLPETQKTETVLKKMPSVIADSDNQPRATTWTISDFQKPVNAGMSTEQTRRDTHLHKPQNRTRERPPAGMFCPQPQCILTGVCKGAVALSLSE
jgi:hypothetical protein